MTVILLLVASLAVAGEKKAEMKAENATFEGKLVCLGCDLKKAEGARAECSVYEHKHTLKTSDGKYVNLLENKYSADLLKGEKYSGKDIKMEYDESQPSIKTKLCLDISKAESSLGWFPKVSLDEGIQKTIDWYKSNFKV